MGSSGSGGAGQQLLLLLVLLGLLGGAGAWNYQRNVAREAEAVRPYRTLSDADLAILLAATESEVTALTDAYASARAVRAGGGGDRWKDFESAQQRGRQVRELGYRVSEHQASVEAMRAEQSLRAARGSELSLLLRRVFVYTP